MRPLAYRARTLCVLATLLLLACDAHQHPVAIQAASPASSELQVLAQRCVEAMLKNTCTALTGPQVSDTAEVVFVAGVGAVDAKAYREIRASGQAMCGTVRQACEQDWGGAQCRVGRSLWFN